MLFNFYNNNNQDAIGVEISSDHIVAIETVYRGDFFMSINYFDIDISYYHNKDRTNNIISENFIKILHEAIINNKMNSANINISYFNPINKRFVLSLPVGAESVMDMVLPIEIQKYLNKNNIRFLELYEYEYHILKDNDFVKENQIAIIVDIYSKKDNINIRNLTNLLPDANINIVRSLSNICRSIQSEQDYLFINFRKNSIEFAICHNNNVLFFDNMDSGLDIIRNKLKNVFNLSEIEIETLYNNIDNYVFENSQTQDNDNKSDIIKKMNNIKIQNLNNKTQQNNKIENSIENNLNIQNIDNINYNYDSNLQNNDNQIVIKPIYMENITHTVNNMLLELQSLCNNILVKNDFLHIDQIYISGDIENVENKIIQELKSIYKKQITVFDFMSHTKVETLEEREYFKQHEKRFAIAMINSLNNASDIYN